MPRRRKSGQETKRRTHSGVEAVSATEAQNNFGRVLMQAVSDGIVFITKYDVVTAVVLSIDKFNSLAKMEDPDLDALSREFDEMFARMQTPESAAGADVLFAMDSDALAETAVRGARQETG